MGSFSKVAKGIVESKLATLGGFPYVWSHVRKKDVNLKVLLLKCFVQEEDPSVAPIGQVHSALYNSSLLQEGILHRLFHHTCICIAHFNTLCTTQLKQ